MVEEREGRAKVKITAMQSGTANLHRRHEQAPLDWSPARRKVEIMLDREWAGPLPIYSYLIEHPEGLFIVDTGDNARNSQRNYLPRTNPFFQYAVQIRVAPEEEIGPRLTAMGIDPARDVRQVIMTHLHHDHTGGLHHFPHTEILADADCLRVARRQRGLIGAVPRSWPRWFDPTPFAYDAGPLGPFARSASLTRDGSILVAETPGHMVGQVNVIVRGEDVTYILAGDLTYNEKNLIEDKVDGVTMNVQTSLASQRAVKAFARSEPSVLLPAHDPDAATRLANRQCMFDTESDATNGSDDLVVEAEITLSQ